MRPFRKGPARQDGAPNEPESSSSEDSEKPPAESEKERSKRLAKAEREAEKRRRSEARKARAERRSARAEAKRKAGDEATEPSKAKAKTPKLGKPRAEKPKPERTRAKKAKPERAGGERPKPRKPERGAKPRKRDHEPDKEPERDSKRRGATPKARRERRPLGEAAKAALSGERATRARQGAAKGGGQLLTWLVAGLKSLLAGLKVIGALALGGLQEIGRFWLRTAEILGNAVLWAERRLRPIVFAALRLLRRGLTVAERVVTPRRALVVVVICVAGVLAASQFVDYRGVKIGAPAYSGVEPVAPAPQTDRQTTGSVHGYAMVPAAVVVIAAALLAASGRWRVARVIPLVGALVIAVSLLLDARKGLDEGEAGIAYNDAVAVLIEGFWLQLVSGAILIVSGILLATYAHRERQARAPRRHAAKSERPRRRLRIAGVKA